MKLVTQNVQCIPEMSQDDVREDVTATGKTGNVIGWQEINIDRYRSAVRMFTPAHMHHYMGPEGCAEPISWDFRYWEALDAGFHVLHEQSQFTETRYITHVLLKNKKTGIRVMMNNAHYIPAFLSMGDVDERNRIWEAGNKRHRQLLETWNERGLAICGTGDFNRQGSVLGSRIGRSKVRYVSADSSIDKLYVIGSSKTFWKVEGMRELKPRHSDHNGRLALVFPARRKT